MSANVAVGVVRDSRVPIIFRAPIYRAHRAVLLAIARHLVIIHRISVYDTGCLEDEFECRSTSRCISVSLVCDGVDNCADASDESTRFDVCDKRLRTCMYASRV